MTVRSRITPRGRKAAAYETATKYNGIAYVPPGPVVAHIRDLVGMGLPRMSIARDAGVSQDYLTHLLAEIHPVLRVRQATALRAVSHRPNERQQRVLSIGAGRRLAALGVLCWPGPVLAAETGMTPADISHLIHHRALVMDWHRWKAVADLYERLSGSIGDSPKSRTYALRSGAFSALDWEDLDIDHPRVTPQPAEPEKPPTYRELSAQRAIEVAGLTERGLSAVQIAERMGISDRQVMRLRTGRNMGA